MPQREHKPLEISERSAEAALFHNSDHVHIKARDSHSSNVIKSSYNFVYQHHTRFFRQCIYFFAQFLTNKSRFVVMLTYHFSVSLGYCELAPARWSAF